MSFAVRQKFSGIHKWLVLERQLLSDSRVVNVVACGRVSKFCEAGRDASICDSWTEISKAIIIANCM